MPNDVIVVPVGGLGNRLFQLATAEALTAARGGRPSLLPDHDGDAAALRLLLGEELPAPPRPALMRCGITPSGAGGPVAATLAAARLLGLASRRRIGASDAFRRPEPVPRRGPVAIVGYVQHPGHFGPGVEAVISRILAHRRHIAPDSGGATTPDRTVLHVRRGDYVRLGWALVTDYYRDALDELVRHAPDMPRAVEIVGDDPMAVDGLAGRLARDGWSVADATGRTVGPGPDLVVEEFWRLATAPRLVMSNSTLCWWAAVVGDADVPGRAVAFPSGWLGAGGDELHRPGWLRVRSSTDGRPHAAAP